MSVGLLNNASIGSVYFNQGKKVAITSAATSVITGASAGAGCMIRVIDMSATASQITFGNATLEADSGTAPGAFILSAANQGTTLNVTGEIYALCDSGSANLAVTPLRISGYEKRGG